MSSETDPFMKNKKLSHHHPTTSFRWTLRRGRQRLPSVRLGGKKRRRGSFLVRLYRRPKWLGLKYLSILKKLKKYYESLVKDMTEGSSTIESFQKRLILETSFAVPVMGLYFNAYPSSYHQYW